MRFEKATTISNGSAQPIMPLSVHAAANRRGIIAMTGAMASFVVNDALVKYVSQSLGGAQLIFIRGMFASVF